MADVTNIEETISPLYKDVDRFGGNTNNLRVHRRILGTLDPADIPGQVATDAAKAAPTIIPASPELTPAQKASQTRAAKASAEAAAADPKAGTNANDTSNAGAGDPTKDANGNVIPPPPPAFKG
jgi:hypothetical protein